MLPDGDTTAHLRKQVGGLFLRGTLGAGLVPSLAPKAKHHTSSVDKASWFEPFICSGRPDREERT